MRKTAALLFALMLAFVVIGPVSADEDWDGALKSYSEGDLKKASRYLKDVIEENPSNREARLLLGRCYNGLGKHKDALEIYEGMLQTDPGSAEVLFLMGVTYNHLEKYMEAINAFERVVEIDPDHAQGHFMLGVVFDQVKSIGRAWEQYKILKRLDKKLAEQLKHVIFLDSL